MQINTDSSIISDFNINNQETLNLKKTNFEKFFDAAIDLMEETNLLQLNSEKLQKDFITGKTDDIITLNMAQSRASLAIQFTAQVTNKAINAYQEIMSLAL